MVKTSKKETIQETLMNLTEYLADLLSASLFSQRICFITTHLYQISAFNNPKATNFSNLIMKTLKIMSNISRKIISDSK